MATFQARFGSMSGTFLNRARISPAPSISEAVGRVVFNRRKSTAPPSGLGLSARGSEHSARVAGIQKNSRELAAGLAPILSPVRQARTFVRVPGAAPAARREAAGRSAPLLLKSWPRSLRTDCGGASPSGFPNQARWASSTPLVLAYSPRPLVGGFIMTRPKEFFDGTEMPTAGWWEALWPDPVGVLRAVELPQDGNVIDLCSGDGWFTLQIAKIASHVIAIDIDPAILEIARKRLTEASVTNCTFISGDAYKLTDLWDEAVDFVFMANAFHGVPDKARMARSVFEVLKVGGEFAIVNWLPRPRDETLVLGEPRGPRTELRMSAGDTIRLVTPSGLKVKQIIDVPPYHYGVVFLRVS